MTYAYKKLAAMIFVMTFVISACSSDAGIGRKHEGERPTSSQGEMEETGNELSLDESFDKVSYGARLSMSFNPKTNTFDGVVENTTNEPLQRVRVEVHLSNGLELGPSTPEVLAPGEKRKVSFSASNKSFNGWTAHAEVGNKEHEGEEGGGEGNRGEEKGEHGSEGGERGEGRSEKGEHNEGGERGEGRSEKGEHNEGGERGEGRSEKGEHNEGGERGEGRGEDGGHAEGSEGHGEEGEENEAKSPVLKLNESWDGVLVGLRIVMSYERVFN